MCACVFQEENHSFYLYKRTCWLQFKFSFEYAGFSLTFNKNLNEAIQMKIGENTQPEDVNNIVLT